jgi:MHS family citrate/tricarballylate:H+ symporter-like MFS transporter
MAVYIGNGLEFYDFMLFALSVTPVIVTITESLPKSLRSGVVATVYAFAISIFGGSTQFVITWLLSVTGDPLAPAYLWFGAALVGLAAMLLVEESSPAHARPSTIAAKLDPENPWAMRK